MAQSSERNFATETSDYRIVELTASALAHGRINLRACGNDFFPQASLGKSKKRDGIGQSLRLNVAGFDSPVDTDIPTDSRGAPRWFFRNRAWVGSFVKLHRLSPGAKLCIRRVSPTEYEIAPHRTDSSQSLFRQSPGDTTTESRRNGAPRRGKNGDLNKLSDQDRPAHDWYRFVLSYPPHLVQDYIHKFRINRRQRVLDPFCGTGTTLVECRKLGIPCVGIEANPLAHFVSRTKIDWDIDPDGLLSHAQQIAERTNQILLQDGVEDVPVLGHRPNGAALRSLPHEKMDLLLTNSISPRPLHKVLVLLDVLNTRGHAAYYNHERLALAKALVYMISNLHFGPEVGVAPAKPDAPVVASWLCCIQAMANDLRALAQLPRTKAEAINADSRQLNAVLKPNSVDAVITSPPYPNEKDYTRTTRLESVLLGFIQNKSDLQALKRSLVRSNTRSVYRDDSDDRWIAEHPEIERIARQIEARRIELGKTSGFERMYARVTRLYFGGMARHFADLRRVLRPGARLAYVVGDQASYLRVMIRTGQILAEIAKAQGYEIIGIDLFRTRLATATREQLREEVLLLRWPGTNNHCAEHPTFADL